MIAMQKRLVMWDQWNFRKGQYYLDGQMNKDDYKLQCGELQYKFLMSLGDETVVF